MRVFRRRVKMDWLDYREALGIGFSDHEKSKYFLNKILNALNPFYSFATNQINEDEYITFCNMTGTPLLNCEELYDKYWNIIKILQDNSDSLNQFLPYYIAFINCQKDDPIKKYTREYYAKLLCQMLDESHISYDLKIIEAKYFLFPKGAKELDDALVSQPLEWLKDYPNSKTAFIKVLKLYSDVDEHNASEIADSFRKALERFFQEFFKSAKTLENLKSEYGAYLKGKGVPVEISNNLETLQMAYTNFINNYAKHHDKTSKNVLEYILYQTGNIIRLLITLRNEENTSKLKQGERR